MLWCFYLLTFLVVALGQQGPTVRTQYGVLRGSWASSIYGRTFASFQRVPYATPPVGPNRFKAPQPLEPWSGEWNATNSPVCLQYNGWEKVIQGEEDCLYLNVYTPNLKPESGLPVVIYIHGGAFMYGGGASYNPHNFMDWDVILVTLNYRLGALGFLSTGDEVVPGNNGLKDQAFALHWIKDNIHTFGGNPDQITLTGNSAGGASVHYHYLSPLSRGTFNRGLAFSGSAFAPWTLAMKPVQHARRLATLAGCPSSSSRAMVECLMEKPGEEIAQAQSQIYDWDIHMFTRFTPTVEPRLPGAFLAEYPLVASKAATMAQVPLIITFTSSEGLYPAAQYINKPHLLQDLEVRWDQLASEIFEYNDTLPIEQRSDVAAQIRQRYLGGRSVSEETFPQLVQALGDRLFVVDCARLAKEHSLRSGQNTYLYRYNYHGEVSLANLMTGDDKDYGVAHADDVLNIFRAPGPRRPNDARMTNILLSIIYSYATTGIPKLPSGEEWRPVDPGSSDLDYLDISSPDQIQMRNSPDFGNATFWDNLGFLENDYYRGMNEV